MRKRVCLTTILFFFFLLSNAQSKITNNNILFFQGTKLFCCDYRKTKYRISIKGNEITITAIYNCENTSKGIIKNSKIYSNDPLEKNKMLSGKAYMLKNNTLHVLTSEGGEYDEFHECK